MNKKIEDLICIAKIENVCENPSELNDTNENFKFMESANYIVVATSHYLFDEEPVDINSKDFAQDWINAFKKSKYYKVPDRRLWINTNHIFNGVYCQYSKNMSTEKSKKVMWIVGRAMVQASGRQNKNITKKDIAEMMPHYNFVNYFRRPKLYANEKGMFGEKDCIEAWDHFEKEVLCNMQYDKIIVLGRDLKKVIKEYNKNESDNRIVFLSSPNYYSQWGYAKEGNDYDKLVNLFKTA